MNVSHRLAVSDYDIVSVLNEEHRIYVVQHRLNHSIAVRKEMDVYNLKVYQTLQSHPVVGTPRILAMEQQKERLIVIEEYISGQSLREKIDAHDLIYESVLYYSMKLCQILDTMHSFDPPIIHRDIKPSNVIITPSGEVVLLDFNAAKQFHSDGKKDTVLLGTKGYAAPEQYGFGSSTPQTDIYGFGMLLREMVSTLVPERYELDEIIQTCTRMDPVDRYRSVKDIEQALRIYMEQAIPSCEPKYNEQSDTKADAKSVGNTSARFSEKITSRSASAFEKYEPDTEASWDEPLGYKFLPPGFRQGKLSHMVPAAITYLFLAAITVLGVSGKYSRPGEGFIYGLGIFIFMITVIFVPCNYLNIQRILPGCRSRNLLIRLISILVLTVAAMFLVLVLAGIVLAILYPN